MTESERVVLEMFGGVATEISFTSPKKVLWQAFERDELIENVTSIDVTKAQDVTSLKVNYRTEEGEGSTSSAIQNITKLVVMD